MWQVIRLDGELVSEHRDELAAVRQAIELGEGHTVRRAGRGRPRKDAERRTERIELRVAPSRKERWRRAAARAGVSLADWLTAAGDAAASAADEQ